MLFLMVTRFTRRGNAEATENAVEAMVDAISRVWCCSLADADRCSE